MIGARRNIVITTACPYFINTGMFKGVKTSRLFPLLNQERVVNRIIYGIEQEEGEFTIPWRGGVINHVCKAILSSSQIVAVQEALVGLGSMDKVVNR